MTVNKNFKSIPERLKFIHLLYFRLSGLNLKLFFMVAGAYCESGLLEILFVGHQSVTVIPNWLKRV